MHIAKHVNMNATYTTLGTGCVHNCAAIEVLHLLVQHQLVAHFQLVELFMQNLCAIFLINRQETWLMNFPLYTVGLIGTGERIWMILFNH